MATGKTTWNRNARYFINIFIPLLEKTRCRPNAGGGQQRKKEWFPRGSDMLTSTKFNDAKPMPIKRKSP